jgi:hypothetical protein
MFCGECGTQNADTNQFCKNCGKPLKKTRQEPSPQPAAVPVRQAAAPSQEQPVFFPPPPPAVVQPPVTVAGAVLPAKTPLNKGLLALGIVGMVAGIAAWFRYPYLLGILAIILGSVVIAKAEKKRGTVFIIALIAVTIGLASIIFDMFYLMILPPVALDL